MIVLALKSTSVGGATDRETDDASELYRKLKEIIPLFYERPAAWNDIMRHAVALNESYFNTHRMVQQYVTNAYLA